MLMNVKFTGVFCGKSHTIALSYSSQFANLSQSINQQLQIYSSSISCSELYKIVKQSKHTNNYEYVISILKRVFSSPGSINASFLQPNKGTIDMKSLFQLYDSFYHWGNPQLLTKFSEIILKLIHKTYTSLSSSSETPNIEIFSKFDIVSQFVIILAVISLILSFLFFFIIFFFYFIFTFISIFILFFILLLLMCFL